MARTPTHQTKPSPEKNPRRDPTAAGQREFNFHSAILEIQTGGDEGQALLLGLADELANLLFMDQQLAGAQGRVVEDVAVIIRADVAVEQPEFAVLEQSVGVFEVRLSGTN